MSPPLIKSTMMSTSKIARPILLIARSSLLAHPHRCWIHGRRRQLWDHRNGSTGPPADGNWNPAQPPQASSPSTAAPTRPPGPPAASGFSPPTPLGAWPPADRIRPRHIHQRCSAQRIDCSLPAARLKVNLGTDQRFVCSPVRPAFFFSPRRRPRTLGCTVAIWGRDQQIVAKMPLPNAGRVGEQLTRPTPPLFRNPLLSALHSPDGR